MTRANDDVGRRRVRRAVASIVVPYAAAAVLWIFVSDRALGHFFPHLPTFSAFSTVKGLAFVAVSAVLLWALLRMELSRREATERALQATTTQLERVQQLAQLGAWTLHLPSERLEWSDEMFNIFGVDRASFTGAARDMLELLHPDDRDRVRKSHELSTVGDGPAHIEYRIVRPDGAVRTLWAESAEVFTDEAGTPVRLTGIVQDITERRHIEHQLLRAQRTEAVGALASGIAHDLNNVLTPVMMIAPLLRERVVDSEDREMLDTLEQVAQRGSDIIRQLLTFARGEPGSRAVLPVRHLIREMEKIARETFPRDIVLHTSAPRDLWQIQGDVTQLHQVLLNLCLNARDAMPLGGQLRLEGSNVTMGELETAPDVAPGRYVRLTVSDTGTGIDDKDLERIFDPFFTTKPVGKGTGLGLSSVLAIVRNHGGFVRVESQPGQGSRFDVYLPAADVVEGEGRDESGRPRARGGELVLVVDDEAAVRETLAQTLSGSGYRVLLAADGAAGLAAFDSRREDVRVILVDVMMPVMSGGAMVAALRARGVCVPVVAMSGMPTSDEPGDGRPDTTAMEAAAWLTKPFTPRDLLDTLDHVLQQDAPAALPT